MVLRHAYAAVAVATAVFPEAEEAEEEPAARARASGRRRRGGAAGAREPPVVEKRQQRAALPKGSIASGGSSSQDVAVNGHCAGTFSKGGKVIRSMLRRAGHLHLQVCALYSHMQKWMILVVLVVVLPLAPFLLAATARAIGDTGSTARPTPVLPRMSSYSEHSWSTVQLQGRRPLVASVLRRLDAETDRALRASRQPVPKGLWGGAASARTPSKPKSKTRATKTGKASSDSKRRPAEAAQPTRSGKKRAAAVSSAGRPREAAEQEGRSQRSRRAAAELVEQLSPEDFMDSYALLAQLRSLAEMHRAYDL